jgi:hypothetical protein
MILGKANVFVHVEGNDILEAITGHVNVDWRCTRTQAIAHDSFPSLTSLIKVLYVGIGDDPVGRPRTKGFSGVGAKALILADHLHGA